MRGVLKRLVVALLVPIMMVTFIMPQNFSLHVNAAAKRQVNVILVDNDLIKATLINDYLDSGNDSSIYEGYNMELEIVNKAGKPILLKLSALKINDVNVPNYSVYAGLFQNAGNSNYYDSCVRINSGKTVIRTATVSSYLMSTVKQKKINTIVGNFLITDLNNDVLDNQNGGTGFIFNRNTMDCTPNQNPESGMYEEFDDIAYLSGQAYVCRYGEAPIYSFSYNGGMVSSENVGWESSDTSIATIENGRLSIKGTGVLVISGTYQDTQASKVIEIVDHKLTINTLDIYAGVKNRISYSVEPYVNEADPDFSLEIVEGDAACVVDKEYLEGLTAGQNVTVKGTYTTGTGDKYESEETVIKVMPLNSFRLNTNRMNLVLRADNENDDEEDDYGALRWIYAYAGSQDLTDQAICSIDNTDIAGVGTDEDDMPYVYAKKAGTATLTVTLGTASRTCAINVYASSEDIEPEEAPNVEEVRIVPANLRGQKLYEGDDYDVTIRSTGYVSNGYAIDIQVENKTTYYASVYTNINSVNGLRILNSNYNYINSQGMIYLAGGTTKTYKIVLTSTLLSLLGDHCTIYDVIGELQISDGQYVTHPFEMNTAEGTTFERTRGNSGTVLVNKDYVDIYCTSIIDMGKTATVNFYVKNKSNENIRCDLFLESVNNVAVSENINFMDTNSILEVGKKMYGSFSIPVRTYSGTKRKINTIEIDVTVRGYDGSIKEDGDSTEIVDASQVPITSDRLTVSGTDVFYLNNSRDSEQFIVYESSGYGMTSISNNDVTWSSSDTTVAVVSADGRVYPKSEGCCLIKAKDNEDGRWGMKTVQVVGDTIYFPGATQYNMIQVLRDCYSYLNYEISSSEPIDYSKITVSCDNPRVKILDKRHIISYTTIFPESAKVTVTYERGGDKPILQAEMNYIFVEGSGLSFNTNLLSLEKGAKGKTLRCNVEPYYGSPYEVEWESENEGIAKVVVEEPDDEDSYASRPQGATDLVRIVPVSAGTTKIYAYVRGYGEAVCLVNVEDPSSGKDTANNDQQDPAKGPEKPKAIGETVTDTGSGASYTLTDDGGVEYTASINPKAGKIVVPDTVTIDGKTYPVTSISAGAFKNNKNITQISVGKNVKVIEADAFKGASKLKTVNLANSNVEVISSGAFKNCKNLKSLKINGNNLKKVSKGAFNGSKKVKVTVYAKNKKTFDKDVKKLKKGGLKSAKFKFKKKK